jgi:hypothetical protein
MMMMMMMMMEERRLEIWPLSLPLLILINTQNYITQIMANNTAVIITTIYLDLTECEGSLVISILRSKRSSHCQVSNTIFVRAIWPNPDGISLLCTKRNYACEVYQITKNVRFSSNLEQRLKAFAKSHWPETNAAVCSQTTHSANYFCCILTRIRAVKKI